MRFPVPEKIFYGFLQTYELGGPDRHNLNVYVTQQYEAKHKIWL